MAQTTKKWSFATCLVRHSTIKLLGQSSWSVESQLRLLKNTSSASGPGCDAAQPLEESTFQGLRGKHNWSCPSICFFHVFLWQTCLDLLVGKRFNNPAPKTIGFAISNLNMAQTHTHQLFLGWLLGEVAVQNHRIEARLNTLTVPCTSKHYWDKFPFRDTNHPPVPSLIWPSGLVI